MLAKFEQGNKIALDYEQKINIHTYNQMRLNKLINIRSIDISAMQKDLK